MKLNQLDKLLNEERMSGVRASWTNREIKNMIKSILRMDAYKGLSNARLLKVFMEKFKRYIKVNNLDLKEIKEIARAELERIKAKNEK